MRVLIGLVAIGVLLDFVLFGGFFTMLAAAFIISAAALVFGFVVWLFKVALAACIALLALAFPLAPIIVIVLIVVWWLRR